MWTKTNGKWSFTSNVSGVCHIALPPGIRNVPERTCDNQSIYLRRNNDGGYVPTMKKVKVMSKKFKRRKKRGRGSKRMRRSKAKGQKQRPTAA